MKVQKIKLVGSTYRDVRVKRATYYDGTLALIIQESNGEPLTKVSVNLEGRQPAAGCVWVKTWSENEGLLEQLEACGALRRTGRYAQAGYAQAAEAEVLIEDVL